VSAGSSVVLTRCLFGGEALLTLPSPRWIRAWPVSPDGTLVAAWTGSTYCVRGHSAVLTRRQPGDSSGNLGRPSGILASPTSLPSFPTNLLAAAGGSANASSWTVASGLVGDAENNRARVQIVNVQSPTASCFPTAVGRPGEARSRSPLPAPPRGCVSFGGNNRDDPGRAFSPDAAARDGGERHDRRGPDVSDGPRHPPLRTQLSLTVIAFSHDGSSLVTSTATARSGSTRFPSTGSLRSPSPALRGRAAGRVPGVPAGVAACPPTAGFARPRPAPHQEPSPVGLRALNAIASAGGCWCAPRSLLERRPAPGRAPQLCRPGPTLRLDCR